MTWSIEILTTAVAHYAFHNDNYASDNLSGSQGFHTWQNLKA